MPCYESIAERAKCKRDTVYEAIKALEFANVLSWVNRLTRIRVTEPDLFGKLGWRWRVIRTSNAYVFRDPLPCAAGRPDPGFSSKQAQPMPGQAKFGNQIDAGADDRDGAHAITPA